MEIKSHLEQRNLNLKENQKAMLSSILNQKPIHINLNRIIVTSPSDEFEILTTYEDINKEAINHYKNAGLNFADSPQTNISDPLIDSLFSPKQHIYSNHL